MPRVVLLQLIWSNKNQADKDKDTKRLPGGRGAIEMEKFEKDNFG